MNGVFVVELGEFVVLIVVWSVFCVVGLYNV